MDPESRSALPAHASRAVRALVILHEAEMLDFLEAWRAAAAVGLVLPASQDSNYASLPALLLHVGRAARGYITWICTQAGLAEPRLPPVPAADALAASLDAWFDALLAGWRGGLVELTDEQLEHPEYESRWGTRYCLDAMLEHAVMHPRRHAFQLRELLATRRPG